jgi:hypothetical protein
MDSKEMIVRNKDASWKFFDLSQGGRCERVKDFHLKKPL